ncbi:MAG: phosphopantetheine-binding protein [Fibrobacterota bacterium]
MNEKLLENLKKQIIETLNLNDVSPEDIDSDAPLIGGDLGIDSIDTLELLVLLEREYGVTVPDVNVGREVFSSVRNLAKYIAENKAD